MTEEQRREVGFIVGAVGGDIFTSTMSDDVLIVGLDWVICVMSDGTTVESNALDWETGWSC